MPKSGGDGLSLQQSPLTVTCTPPSPPAAAPTGSTANYFEQRAAEGTENSHAARLQKMREDRWQREVRRSEE